jgi:hypothetical protein
MDEKKNEKHIPVETKHADPKPADPKLDPNLTLGEKLKIKVDEALESEKDLDPIAAERAVQIFNDAIAGMPPPAPTADASAPEVTMAQQTKAKLDAAVAASTIPEGLAKKLEGLLSDIEAAYKPKEPVPAKG